MSQTPDELFADILIQAKKENPLLDEDLVRRAYELAKKAHGDVVRKSGVLYIMHPLGTARILVRKNYARSEILSAALLHDVIEDTKYTVSDIRNATNDEVAVLVEGLTKIRKQTVAMEVYKAENLRKILLATAKDVRVMVIKIADRIDNLNTLSIFRREKQLRIAKDTLEVYAPITQKLGLYDFKAELEDLAFKYLDPDFYTFLRTKISASKSERRLSKEALMEDIKTVLAENQLPILSISGRAKHLYSVYKKIKNDNKLFEQIYDLYGFRIICETQKQCYDIYGLFQSLWKELPERYKDYIAHPKPNGYQSLHANFVIGSKVAEIQIRTKEMDYQAESGVATHWKYKQTERDKRFDKKLNWLRQLLRWKDSANSRLHVEIFKDEIITVTPKGDPIVLREGSTPVDFAYSIHSGVGSFMKSAKVNGCIVPLNHVLRSGDIVEIETTKHKTVNPNWVSLAKQTSTIAKIRKELGLVVEHASPKMLRSKTKASSADKMQMDNYYQTLTQFSHLTKKKVRIAKCCSPKSEDPIVAFQTKSKKEIVVHKFDCAHQFALDEKMRVHVKERVKKARLHETVHIIVQDRPGIVIEILNYFLKHDIPILRASSKEGKSNMILILEITQKRGDDLKNELKDLYKMDAVSGIKII